MVVIDPPSFAKQESEVELALKKYRQLAISGGQLVKRKGILVLASCSSRVSADAFFHVIEEELESMAFECIDRTFHDSDHPVSFPEGAYLKCGYFQN